MSGSILSQKSRSSDSSRVKSLMALISTKLRQLFRRKLSRDCHGLTVLSDGTLASGSNDNTLRLWDAANGTCLRTLAGHTASVYALAVLPDGHLVSGL